MIDSRLAVFAMVSIITCFYRDALSIIIPPRLAPFFFHTPVCVYTRPSTSKYNQTSIKVPIVPFRDPVSVMRIEIPPLPLFFLPSLPW